MHISASAARFTIISLFASLTLLLAPFIIGAEAVPASISCPSVVTQYSYVTATVSGGTGSNDEIGVFSRDGSRYISTFDSSVQPRIWKSPAVMQNLGQYSVRLRKSDVYNTVLATCPFTVVAPASGPPSIAISGSKFLTVPALPDTSGIHGGQGSLAYTNIPAGVQFKLARVDGKELEDVCVQTIRGVLCDSVYDIGVPSAYVGSGFVTFATYHVMFPGEYVIQGFDTHGTKIVESDVFQMIEYLSPAARGTIITLTESAITVQKSLASEKTVGGRINFSYSNLMPDVQIAVVRCDSSIVTTDHCRTVPFVSTRVVAAGGSGTASLEIYGNVEVATNQWTELDLKNGQYHISVTPTVDLYRGIIYSQPLSLSFIDPTPASISGTPASIEVERSREANTFTFGYESLPSDSTITLVEQGTTYPFYSSRIEVAGTGMSALAFSTSVVGGASLPKKFALVATSRITGKAYIESDPILISYKGESSSVSETAAANIPLVPGPGISCNVANVTPGSTMNVTVTGVATYGDIWVGAFRAAEARSFSGLSVSNPGFQYVLPGNPVVTFVAPRIAGTYHARVITTRRDGSGTPDVNGLCTFTVSNADSTTRPLTLVRTDSPSSAQYCPALSSDFERGATDANAGGQVTELQKFLAGYYGVSTQTLVVGTFGPTTQGYVTRFQAEQQLASTGYVGALTRAAIARVCGGTSSTTPPATTSATPSIDGSAATPSPTATPTAAAPTCTVSYSPSPSITSGKLDITWSSTGATSRTYTVSRNGAVIYGPVSVAPNGSATALYEELQLGKITRVDTVTGPGGTAQCTTSVSVEKPAVPTVTAIAPTCTISYSPSPSISSGQLGITWSAAGATSRSYTVSRNGVVIYGPASIPLSGSATVAYEELSLGKITRVDTVTGAGGTAQCTTAVTVAPPSAVSPTTATPSTTATPTTAAPTCTITYSPTSVGSGGTFSATWTSTNATSRSYTVARDGVQFFGPHPTSLNGSGAYTYADAGGLVGMHTRTDTVTGPGGTAKCTGSIKVEAPTPPTPTTTSTPTPTTAAAPTCTITHSPSTISSGQLAVTWTSTNATSRSYVSRKDGVVNYGPATISTSGSWSIPYADAGSPGTYTRTDTVTGPGGTGECTSVVTIATPTTTATPTNAAPAPVPASPSSISAQCSADGTQATISWPASVGATEYYPRVTTTNGACPAGWTLWTDGTTCLKNNFPSTSVTFSVTPGTSHSMWVHAGNASGADWTHYPTSSFNCSAPAPVAPAAPESVYTEPVPVYYEAPQASGGGRLSHSQLASVLTTLENILLSLQALAR